MGDCPTTLEEYIPVIDMARAEDTAIAETIIPGSVEILGQFRDGLISEADTVMALLVNFHDRPAP